jgi:REP element-mobilizing transposase RayT
LTGKSHRKKADPLIVNEEQLRTPMIRREVELDGFVIMPNHLHGIIIIKDLPVGAHRHAPKGPPTDTEVVRTHSSASLQRKSGTLGSIIAGFKSAATSRINVLRKTPRTPVWQGKFHDHIIHDQTDLDRIREYISLNPIRWFYDEENPANRVAKKS